MSPSKCLQSKQTKIGQSTKNDNTHIVNTYSTKKRMNQMCDHLDHDSNTQKTNACAVQKQIVNYAHMQ